MGLVVGFKLPYASPGLLFCVAEGPAPRRQQAGMRGGLKYIRKRSPRPRPSGALCHYRTVPQLVPRVLLAAASRAMGSCSRHSCRQKTQSSSASASLGLGLALALGLALGSGLGLGPT